MYDTGHYSSAADQYGLIRQHLQSVTIERPSAKLFEGCNNRKLSNPAAPPARTHQDAGGPVGQRAVGDVGVSGDPADVCRAPVDVIGLVVKHQFEGGGGVEHVAAERVKNPLQGWRRHVSTKTEKTILLNISDEDRYLHVHHNSTVINI